MVPLLLLRWLKTAEAVAIGTMERRETCGRCGESVVGKLNPCEVVTPGGLVLVDKTA